MNKFTLLLYKLLSIFYFLLGFIIFIFFNYIPLEIVSFALKFFSSFPVFYAAIEYGHNADRTLVLLFYSLVYPLFLSIFSIIFFFSDSKRIFQYKSIKLYQAFGLSAFYVSIYYLWFHTEQVNSKEDLIFLGGGYISCFFILFMGYLQSGVTTLLFYGIALLFKKVRKDVTAQQ